MTTSQKEKIINFLRSGRQLTVPVATNVLGVPQENLYKRIHDLRLEGATIYTNKRLMKGGVNRGRRVTAYRLATDEQFGGENCTA